MLFKRSQNFVSILPPHPTWDLSLTVHCGSLWLAGVITVRCNSFHLTFYRLFWGVLDAARVLGIVMINSWGLKMGCSVSMMRRLSGNTSALHRNKYTSEPAYYCNKSLWQNSHCYSLYQCMTQYTITHYATRHFETIAPGEWRVFKARISNFLIPRFLTEVHLVTCSIDGNFD